MPCSHNFGDYVVLKVAVVVYGLAVAICAVVAARILVKTFRGKR